MASVLARHNHNLIYIKPWGRISPYLMGLVFGYAIFRQIRFKFGHITNILLYTAISVSVNMSYDCNHRTCYMYIAIHEAKKVCRDIINAFSIKQLSPNFSSIIVTRT